MFFVFGVSDFFWQVTENMKVFKPVVSKICYAAPDGYHCTCPGVSCGDMTDQFSFESVLLSSVDKTDKGIRCSFLWGYGGGWGCLIANEELDVL